jgi:hypothetical protein
MRFTKAQSGQVAGVVQNLLTALRRIKSLDEKNVPKFAQQIATDALRSFSSTDKATEVHDDR